MNSKKAKLISKMAKQLWNDMTPAQRKNWGSILEVFKWRRVSRLQNPVGKEYQKTENVPVSGFNRFHKAVKQQYLRKEFSIR